jgi:hypothetical protein
MFATLVVCAMLASEVDAARLDQARYPAADHAYLYYFTTAIVAQEYQRPLYQSLCYVVASLSRDPYLQGQLPQPVTETLYRIDTRQLKWEKTLPQVLVQHYPYSRDTTSKGYAPLVIRADWFVANIGDEAITKDAQYLLLYGKALANEKEFLAFWSVGQQATDAFGFLEGDSGVKQRKAGLERVMETRPAGRGASFQTFDSRFVAGETDALANPDKRPPKHDATEIIAPIVKVGRDEAGNTQAGALLAFFLANGNRNGVAGAKQAAAPVDIVEDSLNTRGYDIKNYMDCVACHDRGLKEPTLDQYRKAIVSGVLIKTLGYQDALNIERYYESAFLRDVRRGIEDYAIAVKLCNGLTPTENAALYRQVIAQYDADVTLEQAARELYTTPGDLSLALADYTERYKDRNLRLALLAEGQAISRAQFEFDAYKLQEAIRLWPARR